LELRWFQLKTQANLDSGHFAGSPKNLKVNERVPSVDTSFNQPGKISIRKSSSRQSGGAKEPDNDIEMDGGPVKDEDVNPRNQPTLPPEPVDSWKK
jgi:hypothetical protein